MAAAGVTPDTMRYYFPIRTELGSPFIIEELFQRLLQEQRTKLFAFLDTSAGNPRLASLRGQLFELAALERLAAGGTFRARRLTQGGGSVDGVDVTLPPMVSARFATAAALAHAGNRGKLMRPASKTYATVDAVLPARLGVANFTVSEIHNIVIDEPDGRGLGLAAVVAAQDWGAEGEVPFYWVVPDDVYEGFTVGGFIAAGPVRRLLTATEVGAHPLASRVVQYVLRIPPFERGGALK